MSGNFYTPGFKTVIPAQAGTHSMQPEAASLNNFGDVLWVLAFARMTLNFLEDCKRSNFGLHRNPVLPLRHRILFLQRRQARVRVVQRGDPRQQRAA